MFCNLDELVCFDCLSVLEFEYFGVGVFWSLWDDSADVQTADLPDSEWTLQPLQHRVWFKIKINN